MQAGAGDDVLPKDGFSGNGDMPELMVEDVGEMQPVRLRSILLVMSYL